MTPTIEQKIEAEFKQAYPGIEKYLESPATWSRSHGAEYCFTKGFKAAATPLHAEIEKLKDISAGVGMAYRNAVTSALKIENPPTRITPSDMERMISQEIDELEAYKKDWQSIAGKANLKGLIARLDEAEKVIGFYAEAQNWFYPGNDFHDFTIAKDDVSPAMRKAKSGREMKTTCGGKRAREYCAKWSKK